MANTYNKQQSSNMVQHDIEFSSMRSSDDTINSDERNIVAFKQLRPPCLTWCKYLSIFVLTVLLITFIGLYASTFRNKANDNPVVQGLDARTLDFFTNYLNTSVDPCDDFHAFVCSKWEATQPQNITRYVHMSDIVKKESEEIFQKVLNDNNHPVGEFYEGCIRGDYQNNATDTWQVLTPWFKMIDSISDISSFYYVLGLLHGHGMVTSSYWTITSVALNKIPPPFPIDLQLMRTLKFNPSISLTNYINPENLSRFIKNATNEIKQLNGYELFNQVFNIQTIYNQSTIFSQMVNASDISEGIDITELTSILDIDSYMKGLGDHSYIYEETYQYIDGSGYADHIDHIAIPYEYIKRLSLYTNNVFIACNSADILSCSQLNDIKSFLKVDLLLSNNNSLPIDYIHLVDPLYKIDNTFFCRNLIELYFQNVLNSEWFVEGFAPGIKNYVSDMVELIYQQLGHTIRNTQWLDAKTRTMAINKYNLITKNVIFDSTWNDPDYGLVITGNFPFDIIASRSYYMQRLLLWTNVYMDARTPTFISSDTQPMTSVTANAFYMPSTNSINMIPGLMLYPVFDLTVPKMLNIASYGYVIGHEFMHGFDSTGRHFDGIGMQKEWFSDISSINFDIRSQCFIEQYSNFTYYGYQVNGEHTLGENIADNGGMQLAFDTYKRLDNATNPQLLPKLYTNDQLFWIWASQLWCQVDTDVSAQKQIANEHSPGPMRINGVMANTQDFAKSFNCPATSKMGKSLTNQRCKLW